MEATDKIIISFDADFEEAYEDNDDYNYDLSDLQDLDDVGSLTDRPSKFVKRHILPGLHPLIEEIRAKNGEAVRGEELQCPMCRKTFVKRTYQQKFCSRNCKYAYHNKRQVWC